MHACKYFLPFVHFLCIGGEVYHCALVGALFMSKGLTQMIELPHNEVLSIFGLIYCFLVIVVFSFII